jgi:Arc/MetJ family transcription regulator
MAHATPREAMTANRRDEQDLQIDESGDFAIVPGVDTLARSLVERLTRREPPGLARNRRARERWVAWTPQERRDAREWRKMFSIMRAEGETDAELIARVRRAP